MAVQITSGTTDIVLRRSRAVHPFHEPTCSRWSDTRREWDRLAKDDRYRFCRREGPNDAARRHRERDGKCTGSTAYRVKKRGGKVIITGIAH